ncbi:alpha/beta hydrolase [Flavobacterium agricola]|uniref:Alpha/beta hydrolase n=1 Tax=Flavobacterium agricola TaxID=2870839 RepID=A0ABY6M0Q3_9FLAO|nr:alpha/beta hydrolase [Flavobacterium agricola]UYW02137.1 alpha/beta hydrolase [Flavobacterium agricola]
MKNLIYGAIALLSPLFTAFAQMPLKKQITVNNTNWTYYEAGPKNKNTIVLLYGWPQTSYVWRHNIQALSKNNHVIALDLPGMNPNSTVEQYDTKYIATLLNQFLKNLQITKPHVVGHDIGGWVAAAYAIHYEDELATLTVIDAGIPGLMKPEVFAPENAVKIWQFYFNAVNDIPEFLLDGKETEYLTWYFTNKAYNKKAISTDDILVYAAAYKNNMKPGFDYYRAFQQSSKQNVQLKNKLKLPVLAVGGKYAMANQVGLAMQEIANNVNTVVIEDSGHYVPEEQPEKLNQILLQHIQ